VTVTVTVTELPAIGFRVLRPGIVSRFDSLFQQWQYENV